MHVRARPSAVALYGALLAHTLVSAGNYLFAKRALMEIPALPLGLGALPVVPGGHRPRIHRGMVGGRVLDLDDQRRRIPALVLGPRPPRRRARGHFHEPA